MQVSVGIATLPNPGLTCASGLPSASTHMAPHQRRPTARFYAPGQIILDRLQVPR
jgi:hypothetical protein